MAGINETTLHQEALEEEKTLEEITVVGAGGIGGTVAAFLAKAGQKVAVVDPSVLHIQAIRSNGLMVDGLFGTQRVTFDKALFPEEVEGPLGFVILAVKSQHTGEALQTIAPLLSDTGFIVSLQNGLNATRISEIVGSSRTVGGMVHMVADYVGPGHITRYSEGEFYIGELAGGRTDRIQEIARCLSKAVPSRLTENIWGYLWAKLIYCCYLVATALVDAPASEILKPEWAKRIFVALMGEAVEVALAEGIKLEKYDHYDLQRMLVRSREDLSRAIEMLPAGSAKGNSGMWRDIKIRHRKSETEFLTGEVVRIGKKHGLPTILNSRVGEMISEIEAGRRPMSWENLRSLEMAANARLPA